MKQIKVKNIIFSVEQVLSSVTVLFSTFKTIFVEQVQSSVLFSTFKTIESQDIMKQIKVQSIFLSSDCNYHLEI